MTAMSLRTKRAEVQAAVKAIDDKLSDLHDEAFKLHQEEQKLSIQVVIEEKILARSRWKLDSARRDKLYLSALDDAKIHGDLHELVFDGWHCGEELEEGVTLRHDDGEITLHFDKPSAMKGFVERQGLTVDLTELAKFRQELSERLKALNEWDITDKS